MKLTSALGLSLVILLVLSLIIPEVESKSIRPHRGALARAGRGGAGRGIRAKLQRSKKGRKGGKKSKKSRRGRNGKRRGRTDGEIPDADVVTDDAAADPAAAGGEDGEVCEVLMFDRGDGTYSLKFIQNKC